MAITIDEKAAKVTIQDESGERTLPLYSEEAFREIAKLYVKVNWAQKYSYTFSWLGRPIIQLPDDMVRMQELIARIQPDVIIETGVAHGGSLIFYASICRALGKGRVIGIDIEIKPHNRSAIEAHAMFEHIGLIEGSSTAPEIVADVASRVKEGETTLIILDSNHSYAHVLDELRAYGPMVTPGSYIVATDGIMSEVADTPLGQADWVSDNPTRAAADYVQENPEFELHIPEPDFCEGTVMPEITYWPGAWLRRKG